MGMQSWVTFACAVCFGDPDSAFRKGAAAAVFFLMAVVAVVLGGIAATAWVWARRAKETGT